MKIAFISTMRGGPWGGSEELWANTAFEALKSGHEVIVSVFEWHKTPKKIGQLQKAGAKIFFRSRSVTSNNIFSKAKNYILSNYTDDFAEVFKQSPDRILISQGSTFELLGYPLLYKKLVDINALWFLLAQMNHDTGVLEENEFHIARSYFPKASGVFFVSERNRVTAERQLAMNITNTEVVRNPVNLENLNYVTYPAHITIPQFGIVARLSCKYKGHDLLFEVLSSKEWRQRSWQLNIYGDGEDAAYLKVLAKHFQIADKIVFYGQVDDIREVWKNNHLSILPSIAEGLPLALVEATICGRTALVTDAGGNAEWIEDGVNGFVAESAAPFYLGKTLERAWAMLPMWEQLGIKAREEALKKIDVQPGKTLLQKITEVEKA